MQGQKIERMIRSGWFCEIFIEAEEEDDWVPAMIVGVKEVRHHQQSHIFLILLHDDRRCERGMSSPTVPHFLELRVLQLVTTHPFGIRPLDMLSLTITLLIYITTTYNLSSRCRCQYLTRQ